MSVLYERMELLMGSPGAGLMLPGRIQRLLMDALSISSEEIGVIGSLERGRVSVEIAVARSRRLATPLLLPLVEHGRRSLWELRRSTDPPRAESMTLLLRGEGPLELSPGAVASALCDAFGPSLGAEEIGLAFVGARWLRVDLPQRLAAYREPPASLKVGKATMRVECLVAGQIP